MKFPKLTEHAEVLAKMGALEHKQLLLLAYGLYKVSKDKNQLTEQDLDEMIKLVTKFAR